MLRTAGPNADQQLARSEYLLDEDHRGKQPSSTEEELAQEVLGIIPAFLVRLYGSRSPKDWEFGQTLREVAE